MTGNTFFSHNNEPQYTFESENGEHSAIDYMMYTSTPKGLVEEVIVIKLAELSKDHHLVLMKTTKQKPIERGARIYVKINTDKLVRKVIGEKFINSIYEKLRERQQEMEESEQNLMYINDMLVIVESKENIQTI